MAELLADWQHMPRATAPAARGPGDVVEWPSALATMQQEQAELRSSGRWLTGPADLLSLIGLHRWELAHSAALGWLLDPAGSHGLGDGLLRAVLASTGPVSADIGSVTVRLEAGASRSRADVVVRGQTWTLVIEVKVDAVEQPEQVYRLWLDWQDSPDPRFVFLTPGGQRPTTAMQQDCDDAWIALSWHQLAGYLTRQVADCANPGPASAATGQYLATLNRLFGRRR